MKNLLLIGMLVVIATGCGGKKEAGPSWGNRVLSGTNAESALTVLGLMARDTTKGKTTGDLQKVTVFADGLKFVYDGNNISAMVNTNGEYIFLDYDDSHRLSRIQYPDGTFQRLQYEGSGARPSSITSGGMK
jgi:YD repeat-containing protein